MVLSLQINSSIAPYDRNVEVIHLQYQIQQKTSRVVLRNFLNAHLNVSKARKEIEQAARTHAASQAPTKSQHLLPTI